MALEPLNKISSLKKNQNFIPKNTAFKANALLQQNHSNYYPLALHSSVHNSCQIQKPTIQVKLKIERETVMEIQLL